MISIPRGACRAFPAVARRCVSGRPRGPAPVVVVEVAGGALTVWAATADAAVAYTAPTAGGDDRLVVPMAVLVAAGGPGDGPVDVAVGPTLAGEARWSDRGVPTSHPFDAIPPGQQHRPPAPPADWHPVPPAFLAALHECGRTTAKDATRFALTRVQVKGRAGQVVGTDGRTAVLCGGFALPFADDLLVPALPVFAARELAGERPVRVGRTATHLVVQAGPWRVFLPVDKISRYPDVGGVVPRHAPTTAVIDDRDAEELLAALPGLPGNDADLRPVTVAVADGGVVVRAVDVKAGTTEEVRLSRSTATGPSVRAAVDRRVLARALALGCRRVRLAPDKPIVFEGGNTTLLTVALDPAVAVGPTSDAGVTATTADTSPTERRTAVRSETNGHPPDGRHAPPAADPPDPLAAAEELRAALGEAVAAASRLVASLKHRRKEQRALTQVWSSLRALNLGPEGRP